LFDENPYKTVLTLGLVLDKDNQKMSKSKRNYVDPNIILDHEGADAMRWYLVSTNAPWMSTRFYEDAVKDTLGRFLLTYWNSYNFFTTYAVLDQFDPMKDQVPWSKRGQLDQWIWSRFHRVAKDVELFMKEFEIHKAARAIEGFIIDDFSNWYLRRSRKRLWVEEKTTDKLAGYCTMYDVFVGLCRLLAPFIPFITEEMYQNLRTEGMPESVHLCDYITSDPGAVRVELEHGMEQIRALVEGGRALRSKTGLKGRQPLLMASLVCSKEVEQETKPLLDLLKEELNVKQVSYARDAGKFMTRAVKPNYSRIGPRYKEKAKLISQQLASLDTHMLYEQLLKKKEVEIAVGSEKIRLTSDDFEVVEQVTDHVAKAVVGDVSLFLDTTVTPELEAEGLARELIRRIQSMRKDLGLEVEDRISTELHLDKTKQDAMRPWVAHIKGETRSKTVSFVEAPKGQLVRTWTIDDLTVDIGIHA
jgi:isoleucyl-tRNA synthetase